MFMNPQQPAPSLSQIKDAFPGHEIHKIDKGTDIAMVRVISEVVIFGKRLERLNHLFVGIVTGYCARDSRVPQPTS
jgi:hypothetical protein